MKRGEKTLGKILNVDGEIQEGLAKGWTWGREGAAIRVRWSKWGKEGERRIGGRKEGEKRG